MKTITKKRTKFILQKSELAAIAAIELYNKPSFNYKEESFTILIINAWELLLKLKVIQVKDKDGDITSIYEKSKPNDNINPKNRSKESKPNDNSNYLFEFESECNKNLSDNNNEEYEDKSGLDSEFSDKKTINFAKLLKKLKTWEGCSNIASNLSSLNAMRNNYVHFPDGEFSQKFQNEFAQCALACVKNYSICMKDWFKRDISEYNLNIMPLSFNPPSNFKHANKNDSKELEEILGVFLENKKHADQESKFYVAIDFDIKFSSKKDKNATSVRQAEPGEKGIPITLNDGELKARYSLDYDTLKKQCKDRYSNYKQKKFNNKLKEWRSKSKLKENELFLYGYQRNPHKEPKKDGGYQFIYSPKIFEKFDQIFKEKEK